MKLSEGFRLWLEQFGLKSDFHSFRSNAHLIVYFFLGLILTLYGIAAGWKWWVILLAGCAFGLLDEGIKIFLPTREFDIVDLIKDWIGIGAGFVIVWIISRIVD